MKYEELTALLEQSWQEQLHGNYSLSEQLCRKSIAELEQYEAQDTADSEIKRLKILAYNRLGIIYWRYSNYTESLEFQRKALAESEKYNDKQGMLRSLGNIGLIFDSTSEYPQALEYYLRTLSIAEELDNKEAVANTLGNLGLVYTNLSDYQQAIEYYMMALSLDTENNNMPGVARHYGHIGNVYQMLGDDRKAVEFFTKALSIDEKLDNKEGIARHTGNMGNSYSNLSEFRTALECHQKALSIDTELGFSTGIAIHTGNIGGVYTSLGDFPKALDCFKKALALSEENGEHRSKLYWLMGLGKLYANEQFTENDIHKSEAFLKSAIDKSIALGIKNIARDSYKFLYELYKRLEQWQKALEAKENMDILSNEIDAKEAKKKADYLDYERKIAEREKQLATERAHAEATKRVLHNILPPSIANRVVDGEERIAESFTAVTVLFADIVGFTVLSQGISASELVDVLFSQFDEIADKYGLEKIKTIGDAYMAVSGLPEPQEGHAESAAKMAIEMLDIARSFRGITTGKPIELRIGLHSGEVVAGIIGKKKFAYDLWGDAVNIASRMESHGEAGRIHVSEEYASAIGDEYSLIFRGEIEIKGKGRMRTYFLEKKS